MLRAFDVQEMGSVPNNHVAVYNHLYIAPVLGDSEPSTDLCRQADTNVMYIHAGKHPCTYK